MKKELKNNTVLNKVYELIAAEFPQRKFTHINYL